MKHAQLFCALVALCFVFAGCKGKEAAKEAGEAPPIPSAPATPPTVTAAPAPAPQQPLPTEADFEEEAAQQITNKNLEDELDKLERELKSP